MQGAANKVTAGPEHDYGAWMASLLEPEVHPGKLCDSPVLMTKQSRMVMLVRLGKVLPIARAS